MNPLRSAWDNVLLYLGLRPDKQAVRASARLLSAIDDLNRQLRRDVAPLRAVPTNQDREGQPSEQHH
jgi:hypothetical protein